MKDEHTSVVFKMKKTNYFESISLFEFILKHVANILLHAVITIKTKIMTHESKIILLLFLII